MSIPGFEISQGLLNSIFIVLLTAAVTFLIAVYWKSKEGRKEKADELKKLAEEKEAAVKAISDAMQVELDAVKQQAAVQAQQLAVVMATYSPITRVFEAMVMKNLTNSHKPEMDALLVKAQLHSQNAEEHARLLELLAETVTADDDLVDIQQREDAIILPYIMKRSARLDSKGIDLIKTELMVVVVPKDFVK